MTDRRGVSASSGCCKAMLGTRALRRTVPALRGNIRGVVIVRGGTGCRDVRCSPGILCLFYRNCFSPGRIHFLRVLVGATPGRVRYCR